uniref:Uncharacterized protein n=2 Tax=Hemiselmis andersenii TaxID=464988 RepID=A0A6T8JN12_HEMAN
MKTMALSAAMLLSGFAILCIYTAQKPGVAGVELESAILPPKEFRQWVQGETKRLSNAPKHEVPMDRLAGKDDTRKPTVMPKTHAQMELQEARRNMRETEASFGKELEGVEADLEKKPDDPELIAKKKELEGHLEQAKSMLLNAQRKVNGMNKDLVQGRARGWNKDRFLGGSDHIVPLEQAKEQLDGRGYGHRYSITDWLAGE